MSKQQQIKPNASQPVDIPTKRSSIEIPEQDEDVVIGSIGSAEKIAWSRKFLGQIKIKEDDGPESGLIGEVSEKTNEAE